MCFAIYHCPTSLDPRSSGNFQIVGMALIYPPRSKVFNIPWPTVIVASSVRFNSSLKIVNGCLSGRLGTSSRNEASASWDLLLLSAAPYHVCKKPHMILFKAFSVYYLKNEVFISFSSEMHLHF